jgi:rubrerythrin
MIVGGLLLAASIFRLSRLRNRQKGAFAGNTPEAQSIPAVDVPVPDTAGRYCPYCGAEFDDNDDEVCPSCGGRTKKGRPEPQ